MAHVFSENHTEQVKRLLKLALEEDWVDADITSCAIFTAADSMKADIIAREKIIFAGVEMLKIFSEVADKKLTISLQAGDGDVLEAGSKIGTVSGVSVDVLSHERVLLNLLQRLCGVATLTRKFVEAIAGTNAQILDTRKTIPGWRALDKYAVACGGGKNHRMDLASEVMIKDNHIAAAGGLEQAIERVLPLIEQGVPIVVECDTIAQVEQALKHPISRILLDNMPLEMLRQVVRLSAGKIPLEASGGVNLATVRAIAETGVDYISVGSLTHSAVAVDIGLDF